MCVFNADSEQIIKKYATMLDETRGKVQSYHMSQTVYDHLQGVMLQMQQENERLRLSQSQAQMHSLHQVCNSCPLAWQFHLEVIQCCVPRQFCGCLLPN